jgi:hypothetical protein
MQIDKTALLSSNTLKYGNIIYYYNTVDQLYINVKGILHENQIKEIEIIRKSYNNILEMINVYPKTRGFKALNKLNHFAKEFNSIIYQELQKQKYFFRTGKTKQKGFKNAQLDGTVLGSDLK